MSKRKMTEIEPWISIEGVLYDLEAEELTVYDAYKLIQKYVAKSLLDKIIKAPRGEAHNLAVRMKERLE